jgi:hypothetical protein
MAGWSAQGISCLLVVWSAPGISKLVEDWLAANQLKEATSDRREVGSVSRGVAHQEPATPAHQ